MCRVAGLRLSLVEHAQPREIGQVHVQHHGAGHVVGGGRQALAAAVRDDALETHLVGQVVEDACEARVVLHDQDGALAGLQGIAVVGHRRCRAPRRGRHGGQGRLLGHFRRQGGDERGAGRGHRALRRRHGGRCLPGRLGALGGCNGSTSVNTLPWPEVLCTETLPPSNCARSREIDSPSPVPPYLRWVLPSAWRNASKISFCW